MEPTRESETREPMGAEPMTHAACVPHVDIYETETEVRVLADVPGVPPDELRIDFENSVLTLHGRVQDRHPEPGGMLLQEYGVGDFHRTFRVDESIDPEGIHAECCNGTLVLHLPKGKVAGPRRIEIKSS